MPKLSKPIFTLASLALPAMLTAPALAQGTSTGEPDPDFTRPDRAVTSSLSFGFEWLKEADMDDGGDVSVSRYTVDAEYKVPVGNDSMFMLDLGFEHSNYDFDNVFLIPDTDSPVTQVNTYAVNGNFLTPFDHDRMGLLIGGGIKLSGEFDADVSSSITYNALAGIIYNHDPKISIGLGVMVASQLEDDDLIVPFPILKYQFDDRWALNTKGPKIELTYDHSQNLNFGGYLAFENRSFRLESGSGLSSDAAITEQRVPVGIFAVYSPASGLEIRGDVFSSVYTKFEARADDGSEIGNDKSNPGIGFGLSATFRF